MNFAHPSYLWLFLLLIPAVVWYVFKYKKAEASLQISSTYAFVRMGSSYKKYLRHLLFLLRLLAVSCLIIVLARPQVYRLLEQPVDRRYRHCYLSRHIEQYVGPRFSTRPS